MSATRRARRPTRRQPERGRPTAPTGRGIVALDTHVKQRPSAGATMRNRGWASTRRLGGKLEQIMNFVNDENAPAMRVQGRNARIAFAVRLAANADSRTAWNNAYSRLV